MQSWLSQARGEDRSGRMTRNPRAIGIADLGLGRRLWRGPRLGQVELATGSPGPHGPDHRRLGTRSAAASRGPRSGPRRIRRRVCREQPRGQGLGPRVPAGARPPIPRVHQPGQLHDRLPSAYSTVSYSAARWVEAVTHAATTLRPRPDASSLPPRVRWAPTGSDSSPILHGRWGDRSAGRFDEGGNRLQGVSGPFESVQAVVDAIQSLGVAQCSHRPDPTGSARVHVIGSRAGTSGYARASHARRPFRVR
jgi:hypothetical protein